MKRITCALLAMALTVSNLANAATDAISCKGKVETLSIHGTDRIFLQLQGMNTVVNVCNLTATIGTTYPISPQQCKAVYGALMLAMATDKIVGVFFDNVATGTNCTNFATWEMATARYVALTR